MVRLKSTKTPVELKTLKVGSIERLEEEEEKVVKEVEAKQTPNTPNGLPIQQETFSSHYNPQ